jgi:hypothetical protein
MNSISISFENLFRLNVLSMRINIIIINTEKKVSKSTKFGMSISINFIRNRMMIIKSR